MSYTTLVGPKGSAGSIANWVSYTKLDIATIVDEAQSLLFQMLRVREMRTTWTFALDIGQSSVALPSRFLDPIGKLFDTTNSGDISHRIESEVLARRAYSPVSGSFDIPNPFATQIPPSQAVFVFLTGQPFTQGSTVTIINATGPVDGVTFNGTFPVVEGLPGAAAFRYGIDNIATVGGVFGGGSAATYTGNVLNSGYPSCWAIFGERVNFDLAFDTATTFRMLYYRSPLPLSDTNPTNWLTTRYPILMRKACQAAAADFMKDDVEYKKCVEGLAALIQSTAAVDDLSYRGAEFGTDTP